MHQWIFMQYAVSDSLVEARELYIMTAIQLKYAH